MISKDIIDLIKAQNDIVDVISSYIKVNDKNKALCPFHNDHNESLSISKDKQIFKCFSCGVSGNVITFVERFENCTYAEALQKLADRVNIKTNFNINSKKVNPEVKKIYDINKLASKYFVNNILSTEGKEAIKYLSDRGLTKELISDFNIGYATPQSNLSKMLTSKFDSNDLIESGIIKEYDNKYIDTFQKRIIFPIIDEDNNVIAFSGRKFLKSDLENDSLPKYSNTKETKAFNKSTVMYNLNNAKSEILKKKEIIITEGFMDTIRMHSIGYKNVIALMGTAFTKYHLDKILKFKCKVVLNLDQDNPGVVNTISIGEELIKNGIDTTVIVFEDYKDSDEFIVNKGSDSFDIAYNNRVSFIDFKLKHLKSNKNMKDAVEVSKYINEAIKSLNLLDDDILKELKINELSKEFDIDESIIKSKIVKKEKKKEEIKEKKVIKYNKYDISELRILYLMLNYEDVINVFENHIGALIKDDRSLLAYKILEFRNDYGVFNYSDFIDYIKENNSLNDTLEEVMRYHNNETYTESELDSYIKTIKTHSVNERVNKLKHEMSETLDINKKIEIAEKIEKIKKEVLEW